MISAFLLLGPQVLGEGNLGRILTKLEDEGIQIQRISSLVLNDEDIHIAFELGEKGDKVHQSVKKDLKQGISVVLMIGGYAVFKDIDYHCNALSQEAFGVEHIAYSASSAEARHQLEHFFTKRGLL
jgi:nucleoside diphosphate kinase